ncbi:hypothetical protein CFC21_046834 [Triticum aestivum]|uniref:Uncharacterized protein n=2 Tax=Triticum aestivum TaxID=4565 RepID=A0A9R1FWU2_WHEAT|nr:hypothetical protein CFC21_046834 [Triticum aestivum]
MSAATGEEVPPKGKRKLAAFEEKPRWHWADPLPKPGTTTEDAELRKRIKAALLGFPESGALSAEQMELAIDRIIKESKPETKSVAAPGMVRLRNEQIRLWLMLKNPTGDDILGVEAGGVFPPGWIQQRALMLDARCQRKTKDDELILVDKIRIDVITKGYAEFREEYVSPDSDPDEECYVSEEEVTSVLREE